MNRDLLRELPSVDELVESPALAEARAAHDRELIVAVAREVIEGLRRRILTDEGDPLTGAQQMSAGDLAVERVAALVRAELVAVLRPSLRPAINATGIILHTGLGRALLPEAAVAAIHEVARGYSTLAVDLQTGERGSRDEHVAALICRLTGAEAATVAGNNAAATMVVLSTLAAGREVIVSRGQLVEIGGSFRMPDVMAASGAIMREVGTTNKTHLRDYEAAIGEHTGAILRVHQSNYRIVGFFSEPPLTDLVGLARRHGLPVIDDLGSGALVDLGRYGLEREPMVRESIATGADVACFSADKLIGGPQAGIIVGTRDAIARIKRNPLARAFRVGKLTIAGLEATLRLFLDPARLEQTHPTYRMLATTVDELDARAQVLAGQLAGVAADVTVIDGHSQVGSGSVPAEELPTRLVALRPAAISADELARRLRRGEPAIFARIQHDAVLLDPRTIQPSEDAVVVSAIAAALQEATP